jgi:hypothetical protein
MIFYGQKSMAAWPNPDPENCIFYSRLERVMNCKSTGVNYLSDYAPSYCELFKSHSSTWSEAAQIWTKKTRGCLQEMLYEQKSNPKFNCENLEKIAFQSHSACYNEGELCHLEFTQILQIFKIVKFNDYFKELRYADGGMMRLVNYCAKRFLFN